MKKVFLAIILAFFFIGCEMPYKIIETTTTDSLGRKVTVTQKIYSDGSVATPQASVNVVTSPFWWGTPYYPYYSPRVIIPVGPRYVSPRGGYRRR